MKTKIYIISAFIFAALGFSFFASTTVSAAPKCGDTDFVGPCQPPVPVCGDVGFMGPCAPTDYKNEDCSANKYDRSYEGRDRCEAVKSCINDRSKTQASCLDQWSKCFDKANNDSGRAKSDERQQCANLVATGSKSGDPLADADEDKTSCAIDGIGWIVCPVVTFLGKIVDASYATVEKLLVVQPLLVSGDTKGIYKAWTIMRDFANVAFVIAFLIIIFSQLTSIGISNYGIKKMLPRLIFAAILVNISYWVCAIAVDASNILGSSIKALFDSIGAQLEVPKGGAFSGSGGWAALGSTVIAVSGAAALLYVGLSALLPALLIAVLAIVTVFIVLTVRQALIILLIVVAPLAFVAYLLPNTEGWFNKWKSLLWVLLAMYPIIAGMFGAASLASQIVMSASDDVAVQIMGALIGIAPLALTPLVMKSAGGVLGKIGAAVNNKNKGVFDRAQNRAKKYRGERQALRNSSALNGNKYRFGQSFVRRSARRDAITASRESSLRDATTRYVADQALENGGDNLFARQMAGGGRVAGADDRMQAAVMASAISQEKKAFQEDVSNMEALVKVKFDKPEDALREAIQNGDRTQAIAAQNLLFKSGGSGVSKFREVMQQSEADTSMQAGLSQVDGELRSNIKDVHGRYAKEKGADIVSWANNKSTNLTNASAGQLSDSDLAGQHAESIRKSVEQGNVSKEQAERILDDPRVSARLDDRQRQHLMRAKAGDTRGTPSREEIDRVHEGALAQNEVNSAHEEALVQNALHDMNNRNNNNQP